MWTMNCIYIDGKRKYFVSVKCMSTVHDINIIKSRIFGKLGQGNEITHCLLKLNWGNIKSINVVFESGDKILHWLACQLILLETCIRACKRFLSDASVTVKWRWNVYRTLKNMCLSGVIRLQLSDKNLYYF